MRIARVAAVLAVLPLAGCILAVDHGSRKSLEKRIVKLEKRAEALEQERALPEIEPLRERRR